MGLLAFARDERVILVGLAAVTIGVVAVIRSVATFYRDEAEIQAPQPKTQYITQETEDSLKLSTLDNLLGHYNWSIRETAAKIVYDRAVNDEATLEHLLYGITREDYDERVKSVRALALMLTDHHNLHLLHTERGCKAIVKALELGMDTEQELLNDRYWDEYALRDMTERLCIMFILQLLMAYGPDTVLRAQFVEKWLARQNWGESVAERQQNFADYMEYKQNRLTDVVRRIRETRLGRRTLERVGLAKRKQRAKHVKKSTTSTPANGGGGDGDGATGSRGAGPEQAAGAGQEGGEAQGLSRRQRQVDGEEVDGWEEQDFSLPHLLPGEHVPRVLEQSAEEQRLRRQHRHAMVLNDGTRPIGREDIIERTPEHDFN